MQLLNIFGFLLSMAAAAAASSATIARYDKRYADRNTHLFTVECYDGSNGLATRYGWTTLGNVRSFPDVAAASFVVWDSPQCGTCWRVSYTNAGTGQTRNAYVTMVDFADGEGFVLSTTTFDRITGGLASKGVGSVKVQVEQVRRETCGL
ncbi:EC5 protein [Xylariaceae sp. FL0594]|nr:EC5 protein [Xylariaceae sp. FL0594]